MIIEHHILNFWNTHEGTHFKSIKIKPHSRNCKDTGKWDYEHERIKSIEKIEVKKNIISNDTFGLEDENRENKNKKEIFEKVKCKKSIFY